MNRLLSHLPVQIKLILIGLIPLAFLIYLAIQVIKENNSRIDIVTNVVKDIDKGALVMELSSALHQERRVTYGYLYNNFSLSELAAVKFHTNEALSKLEKVLDSDFTNYTRFTLLDELSRYRNDVLNSNINVNQVLDYYTNVLFKIHASNSMSVSNIPYLKPIEKDVASLESLSQVLNYFGMLRAKIYSAARINSHNTQEYAAIRQYYSLIESYWQEYQVKADTASVKKVQAIAAETASVYIDSTLKYVVNNSALPDSFDANKWWISTSSLVDKLRTLQNSFISSTRQKAQLIHEAEKTSLNTNLTILFLIIALVIFLVFYTIKNINDVLTALKHAAERIAKGETHIALPAVTNDAIGSLASSIHTIDINSAQLAKAANAIGSGDFSVNIHPRSEKDVLGNALVKMKTDLAAYRRENKEKLWIQTGINQISVAVQGEKNIRELANEVLKTITAYTKAQVGLIYTADDKTQQLRLAASFAASANKLLHKDIQYGETLTGEVARTRKIMVLQQVDERYPQIESASSSVKPRSVIILPLVFNDELEGVLELASVELFSNEAIEFLSQSATHIAIAIQTSKNRTLLQEFLEETQAQSEELQAQHSELENINAELEAQALKLQTSEEELKVQQEELLEANKELEERSKLLEERNHIIQERNIEIQKKAEELELSTKYKSEFLANMSHELRTPLNSILLLSRLLSENSTGNLDNEQIEYAKVIQSSGNGLLSLIDEILDLSKIEAGKMQLEFTQVSVRNIVGELRQLFAPLAKEKNIEFDITVQSDIPSHIETDKMRLEQILRNLLSNALKFTTEGFVKLTVSISEKNQSAICFQVKDSGIGIPKEKQQLIFEAFQQADGSTRRKFGGTGLGLSISRELAKLLGGDIILQSEPAKGSEFTLCLPEKKQANLSFKEVPVITSVTKPKTDAKTSATPLKHPTSSIPDDRNNIQSSDKTILIVEDDAVFAMALMKYTRDQGYKCVVAVRGDEGLELAKTLLPTGILLDIQLPVKSGWEIMEELKANPATRHIPVHMMSAEHARKESISRGAIDFINKSMAFEKMHEVFKRLENVLNKDPKKVLIVEENPKHAKALAYFLETVNVNSEVTNNVETSISALKQKEVDCVILDIGVSATSAYDTLEYVKKTSGFENLPIIIFTGKNLSQSEESKIRQYADSIVVKTAHSYQRILDEVSIFLHLVEEQKTKKVIPQRKLGALTNVLEGKKVLIADDDVRNIFSLTKPLEMQQMKVYHAMDGKEALKMLNEQTDIDIVLMDMMMPLMDGYESIKEIRKNYQFKDLPVIAVTAKAMTGDREKCIQAGASDYISKPVDMDQLLSLLRVWLYDKS